MTIHKTGTRRLAVAGLVLAAGALACNEDFVTGPNTRHVTLQLRNWADTLVLGDQRNVGVRVLDDEGREVLDAKVRWDVAAPAVVGSRLNSAAAAARASIDAIAATDSVQLSAQHAGASDVVVKVTDPRFVASTLPAKAVVVAAGVRVTSAHDTTVTALGDTSLLLASALARRDTSAAAALAPVAGQGLTWTRRGPGAVTLVGSGDSVRVVATAPGTDTLVATHALCRAGARCADTVVVHVAQTAQPLAMSGTSYSLWAFGDSVAPAVVLQDARGNGIAGARLTVSPVAAADSAIVGVNTAAGVPAQVLAGAVARFVRGAEATAVVRPLVLIAPTSASAVSLLTTGTTMKTLPLVAQANGTARVVVRALASNGLTLASDTIRVVVRQVAQHVRVEPAVADLTPGDSIPVALSATDARGHRIADATFQATIAGAMYRNGMIVVPQNATAGLGSLAAVVTGAAAAQNNVASHLAAPAPDSSHVTVRVPAPAPAGSSTGSALSTTVLDANHQPVAGVWVRFIVPAGTISPDSVMTDANGLATASWTLPTATGTYTATAVRLGAGAPADSAGRIVLRRTETVVAGAPAAVVLAAAPSATAAIGATLATAPAVQLRDAYGNPIRQAGVAVTVTVADTANGFSLGGTLTVLTDSSGVAHFTDLVGNGAAGSHALAFSAAAGSPPAPLTVATTDVIAFGVGAANATQSTVAVSADSVVVGDSAVVTITPMDAGGNRLGAGHTVAVNLPAPSAGSAAATVRTMHDNGDGTYSVVVVGDSAGTALNLTATVDGTTLSAPATLKVVAAAQPASGPTGPALSITSVEKLPGGTQQFRVDSGPAGPYVWSVNDVDGGDATYGTVSTSGFYTAPSAVPAANNPVQVCVRVAADATKKSCASVTISATPSAGADVVVFNDINMWASGSNNGGDQPGNQQLFANLVNFTAASGRATQTHALFYNDGQLPACGGQCGYNGQYTNALQAKLTSLGYTVSGQSAAFTSIASDVKILFIFIPARGFSTTEVNLFKQFASEGGRLVVVGENINAVGQSGIDIENTLLGQLGAKLTNQGACLVPGANAPTEGSHQLVSGVSGIYMNCVSGMTTGPNDFVLARNVPGGTVVGAVAKIDVTPIAQ